MKRLILCLSAFLSAVSLCFGQETMVGQTLPKWQEGELDIHFISTGRGESTYIIFPDGTTFLVDAGFNPNAPKGYGKGKWMPNENTTVGQVVTNYIRHFSPEVAKGHINYCLLTNHREDHLGHITKETPLHDSETFKLSGITEVGANIPIDRFFDRDWPNFNYPREDGSTRISNFINFLDWTKMKNKTKAAKWEVGSSTQVVPIHDKSCGVIVRNLAGNGYVADGPEGGSHSFLPPPVALDAMEKEAIPNENYYACAFMLSYGKFDYFSGGDLESGGGDKYPYKNAESQLIPLVHKVEVMKANHFGMGATNKAEFIKKLSPDAWLVGVWTEQNMPATGSVGNLLKANPNCDIFCTQQSDANLSKLVGKVGMEAVVRTMWGKYGGHIVVRVANGGDTYNIYMLDDTNEEYKVKSIHGPYVCSDPE